MSKPLAQALEQSVAKRQPPQNPVMRALAGALDEATGAFARYGRRSGAQRDASLALMSQAADPNTDPLTGAGMKALGLAGLVTHPLAFFPTREEWDERLANAGNDSRIGRSIGGLLSDLPSLIDPQMAAGGAALAAAPVVGKLAKPGLGKGLGDLLQDAANNKELDALGARLQAEAAQVGGSPSTVSREQALQGLVSGGDEGFLAYHGTPEKGVQRLSTRNAIETPGAVFASNRDDVAETFTHPREYGEPVYYDEAGNDIPRGEVLELRLTPKNVMTYPEADAQRFIEDSALQARAVREAKAAGHDMIHVKNVLEGIGERMNGDVYVVLDDRIITILRRYGIPMTAGAGGAMMIAGQDMPPEFASQMGGA